MSLNARHFNSSSFVSDEGVGCVIVILVHSRLTWKLPREALFHPQTASLVTLPCHGLGHEAGEGVTAFGRPFVYEGKCVTLIQSRIEQLCNGRKPLISSSGKSS